MDGTETTGATTRRPRRSRRSAIRRIVLAPGAWVLLALGIVVFLTPLPLGLLLIAIAVMVLMRHSPRGRWAVARLAQKFPETAAEVRLWRDRIRAAMNRRIRL